MNNSKRNSSRSSRANIESGFLPDGGVPSASYGSVAYSPVPYYSGNGYMNGGAGRPAIRMNSGYSISSPQLLQNSQGGYYVYGSQLYYPMYPASVNDDDNNNVEYMDDSTENDRDSGSDNPQDEDEKTIQDDNHS